MVRDEHKGTVALGIDPGYGRCGVAVVERTPQGTETLRFSTCIETQAKDTFSTRLHLVMETVRGVFTTYSPDYIALEKLYFTKNQKTAMRVAEVRGALLAFAAETTAHVLEYGPGEIKSAITGDGRADKKQVAHMVSLLVDIQKPILRDDEYDAIAVALTALTCARSHVAPQ